MTLKIKHKLLSMYISGGLLLIFTTVCALIYLDKLDSNSEFIHHELLPLLDASKEVRTSSLEVYSAIEIELLGGPKSNKISITKNLEFLAINAKLISQLPPEVQAALKNDKISEDIATLTSEVSSFVSSTKEIITSMSHSTGVGSQSDVEFDALYDDIVQRLFIITQLKQSQNLKAQFKLGNARYLLAHGHLITAEILSGDFGESFKEVTDSFEHARQEIVSIEESKTDYEQILKDIKRLSSLAVQRYDTMLNLLQKRKGEIKNFNTSFKQFNEIAVTVEDELNTAVLLYLSHFKESKSKAQLVMYSVSIFGILSIILLSLYSMKEVVVPFSSLTASIQKLQQGVQDFQTPGLDREDEIGDMARVVEDFKLAEAERIIVNEKLKIASDEAQKANLAKSQFLANMSHEIRTPLNSIIGYSDILADDELSLEQRNMANSIKSSSEVLLDLVNDVLDLAKVESGEMTLENIPVNLEDLIFEVCEAQVSKIVDKKLEINVDFHDVYSLIYSDPTKLKQVFMNLIGNAVKFTESGEIVTSVKVIEENETQSTLRLSVRDTGIGMTPDQAEIIFEAFKQADGSTTRKFGGTGLGLNITKKILAQMGTEIQVESQLGEGSEFSFELTFEKYFPDIVEEVLSLAELDCQNLLVVDDNPTAQKILARYLNIEEMNCFLVSSADEALEFLAKNKIDVLFLDLMMPLKDGFFVAKEVRQKYPQIKLIASTADISANTIAKVKEYGFDAYILKPLRRKVVYSALRHLYLEQEQPELITEEQIDNQFIPQQLLVVDDNAMNLKLASKIFSKMGHKVDTVNSGKLALEKIHKEDFNIIFMDMQMPEMSGVETTIAIRQQDIHTPIIALTANAFDSDKKECLAAGMDDFTTKPLRRNELHRLIQKYTETQGKYLEKRVLIIEDDRTVSQIIYSLIEINFPAAIIKQSFNGLEAMSLMGCFMPNLVILDFMLPDLDGTKIMEFLKSHDKYKDVDVLVNSSLDVDDERILKIKEMGAFAILNKNDMKNNLISSLSNLL
jgi:signal transduction histidine kinase/DNA-binding response OmpR family regulator